MKETGTAVDRLRQSLVLIPVGLRIATMTITCRLDTKFNLHNIGKYIDMDNDGVVHAKFGDKPSDLRTLLPTKSTGRRKVKPRRNFNNQCSLKIHVGFDKLVSVKLFVNGSIQMAGCKSIDNFTNAFKVLLPLLRKRKATFDRKKGGPLTVRPFVTNPSALHINKLVDAKIALINCNYKIMYQIDYDRLAAVLTARGINHRYQDSHTCVTIFYNHMDRKDISIFVFKSGSIIITGAKNGNHISKAYHYVNDLLQKIKHDVIKHDVDDYLNDPVVRELISKNTRRLRGKDVESDESDSDSDPE